ncbi:hypothetical protein Tco_0562329 [Tanacetum coccineum]
MGRQTISRNNQHLRFAKKAFIQRYCLPSKTTKKLKEIHYFKQEGDEILYQAWERYNDLLYMFLTYDLNNHQKALDAIQTMVDHSQKWHDGSTIWKLKENVHAIQVGCKNYGETHLNKTCSLHEEAKSIKEVKYGKFGRPFPNNNRNGAKYRVGQPGYYIRIDNRPPFGEKKPSIKELMNKHLEESTRRKAKMEDWIKELQESTEFNTINQNASLKNLET